MWITTESPVRSPGSGCEAAGGSDNLIALLEGFQYKGWQTGYPSGFTDRDPNATILLSGGGLESDYAFDFYIQNARGRLAGSTNDPVAQNLNMALKFNVLAGLFSGSFDFPDTKEKVKVMGGIGIEPRFNTGLALPQSLMRGSFLVAVHRTNRSRYDQKEIDSPPLLADGAGRGGNHYFPYAGLSIANSIFSSSTDRLNRNLLESVGGCMMKICR
jgi:hypothetical protein